MVSPICCTLPCLCSCIFFTISLLLTWSSWLSGFICSIKLLSKILLYGNVWYNLLICSSSFKFRRLRNLKIVEPMIATILFTDFYLKVSVFIISVMNPILWSVLPLQLRAAQVFLNGLHYSLFIYSNFLPLHLVFEFETEIEIEVGRALKKSIKTLSINAKWWLEYFDQFFLKY